MSNLSRYQGRARREARKAANSIRYNNVTYNNNKPVSTVPMYKKSFLEFLLQDSDQMIICDPDYILPQCYLWSKYLVKNDVFNSPNQKIPADKIGIIWSPKKKMYYMLAINDDYRCYILFKGKSLKDLPNVESRLSNMDKVDTLNIYQITESANRRMVVVFDGCDIWDLSLNPILNYNPIELFRK